MSQKETPPNAGPAAAPGECNESVIKVLEGIEHVRTRPGRDSGDTTPRGLHHLVY